MDKKFMAMIILAIAVNSLSGCETQPIDINKPDLIKIYQQASPSPEDFRDTMVATIHFNNNTIVEAKIDQNSTIADRISKAIEGIKTKESLDLVFEEMEGTNLVMKARQVKPGEENYIYAVENILRMEYGIRAETTHSKRR